MAKKAKKTEQSEEQNPTPEVTPQSESPFLKSILSTIATQMSEGTGTGVDSPQVRAIIKEYLGKDKVQLDELDQSVLDEIKKNQLVTLNIPGFAKPIEISSGDAEIPNFYEIIDDVLAGNNVY